MRKILFIEDDPKLAEALKKVFELNNFELLIASDGEEGLKKAKEEKFDLILLDIILPRKDGFEVLRELKNDPNTSSFPVIILTNLESSRDIDKMLALGADSYLVKANYSLEEILNKVKEMLKP